MTAITVILLSYCDVKKCRRRVCCCGLDVVPSFGDRPTTHCTHMANPNVLLQMLFFILTSLSLGVNFVDYADVVANRDAFKNRPEFVYEFSLLLLTFRTQQLCLCIACADDSVFVLSVYSYIYGTSMCVRVPCVIMPCSSKYKFFVPHLLRV